MFLSLTASICLFHWGLLSGDQNIDWKNDFNVLQSEISEIIRAEKFIAPIIDRNNPVRIDAKAGKETLQGQLFGKFAGEIEWKGKFYEYSQGKLGIIMSESIISLPNGYFLHNIIWVKLKSRMTQDIKYGQTLTIKAELNRPSNENPFSGALLMEDTISIQLINGTIQ
jgi:hypothetical protein